MLNEYKPQMCKCRQLPLDQAVVEGICLEKSCNKPIWCKYCINADHNPHQSRCFAYNYIQDKVDVQLLNLKENQQLILLIKAIQKKIQKIKKILPSVNNPDFELEYQLNILEGKDYKLQRLIKQANQLKQECYEQQYEKVQDKRSLLMKIFNLRLDKDAIEKRQKQLKEKQANIKKIKLKLISVIKQKGIQEEQKALIQQGEQLLKENKIDEAYQFYEAKKKGNLWAIFGKINCLIKIKDYNEALNEVNKAVVNNKKYQKNIELYCIKREIMIKLGKKINPIDKKIADLKSQERQEKEDNSDSRNRRDQLIDQYGPIQKILRPNP